MESEASQVEKGKKTFEALLCESHSICCMIPLPYLAQGLAGIIHQSHQEKVGAVEIAAVSNSYFDLSNTELLKVLS